MIRQIHDESRYGRMPIEAFFFLKKNGCVEDSSLDADDALFQAKCVRCL